MKMMQLQRDLGLHDYEASKEAKRGPTIRFSNEHDGRLNEHLQANSSNT